MNRIRRELGWSLQQLADFLYYEDKRGLARMEDGSKPISGPIRRVMEALDAGLFDPWVDWQ